MPLLDHLVGAGSADCWTGRSAGFLPREDARSTALDGWAWAHDDWTSGVVMDGRSLLTPQSTSHVSTTPNAALLRDLRPLYAPQRSTRRRRDQPADCHRPKNPLAPHRFRRAMEMWVRYRTCGRIPALPHEVETRMSRDRDRGEFWVDLIVPIGAALVFLFSMSTIFFDRHHADEAAHAPAPHNQQPTPN
jgi:hypothetical protein